MADVGRVDRLRNLRKHLMAAIAEATQNSDRIAALEVLIAKDGGTLGVGYDICITVDGVSIDTEATGSIQSVPSPSAKPPKKRNRHRRWVRRGRVVHGFVTSEDQKLLKALKIAKF